MQSFFFELNIGWNYILESQIMSLKILYKNCAIQCSLLSHNIKTCRDTAVNKG